MENTLKPVAIESEKQIATEKPIRKLPHSAWKKGQSGNLKGRPKKDVSITSITKEMLDKPAQLGPNPPDFMKGFTWAQLIAYKMLSASAKPNPAVLKELLDRIEGRTPQPIVGGDGGPVEIQVVWGEEKQGEPESE